MAEVITDKHVVAVLRPFVRATAPMLDALSESDPLGLVRRAREAVPSGEDGEQLQKVDRSLRDKLIDGLDSLKVPGTSAWDELTDDERSDWWVNRVGRFTTLLVAVPGLGGALADRLPI